MGNCAYQFSRFIVNKPSLFVKEGVKVTCPRCMLRAQPICRYSEACKCTPRITAVIELAALLSLRHSMICTPPHAKIAQHVCLHHHAS